MSLLPSSKTVCDVLIEASKSSSPINNLRGVPRPLLSAIYPSVYKSESAVNSDPENVSKMLPFETNLVVMLSGGIGSTASLWKVITSGRDFKTFFVEGMYSKTLEGLRKKIVKDLMTESRGNNGMPLADGSVEEGLTTWLESVQSPKNAYLLNRKARIALSSIMAYEKFGNSALVWGTTMDCLDVFRALRPWNITHVIPFEEHKHALFCLSNCEIISDNLREKHNVTGRVTSAGPMLIPQCLNLVCSCWDHPHDTNIKYAPRLHSFFHPNDNFRTEALHKPFISMCGQCKGCARWYEAVDKVYSDVPNIRFGSKQYGYEDEDRCWKNIPSLIIEPRRKFIPPENIRVKVTKRSKPKAKKAAETSDTEDEKDKDDDDAVESEGEASSSDKENDDYLHDLEDEEETGEQEEEIPEELLSDDDGGYGSDSGERRGRKRRRKY